MLQNKKILIGITGSIAAYKTIELIRLLKKQDAEIKVVLTESAQQFVTKTTLQAISGNPVRSDLWNTEDEANMDHIKLARWADLILIVPCSANLMAKLSYGLCDDLLSTLCIASDKPIALAPAMNQQMWRAPATQENLSKLQSRNIIFWGPEAGEQACGETGLGRMMEPEQLFSKITDFLNETSDSKPLSKLNVMITAGPTREAIDPVRYISNHSSGKMGYALAAAAQNLGANVTLISGPTQLQVPANIKSIHVISALNMFDAVMTEISQQQIFIGCAAVADYRITQQANEKIKKQSGTDGLNLELTQNPDIIAEVAKLPNGPMTIGFAAETDNLIEHAKQKLSRKQLDMIIANWVGTNQGFHVDENKVWLLWQDEMLNMGPDTKINLAHKIIEQIARNYHETTDRSQNH